MARFLVVLDVDSTLIDQEVIELLASAAGSLDAVADVTLRAMNGELDFAASLRERVATLSGLPVAVLDDVRSRVTVTRGVPELVEAVHAGGGVIGVVSGGFHEVVDEVAERLGLDRWLANRLEVEDGALTGRTTGPVIDAEAKAAALRSWAEDAGIPMSRTIAIGDGANDLAMMAAAGLAVGFDAKAPVRGACDVILDERDLSYVANLLR